NFAVVEAALPQFGHVRARGAAHSSQNFAPVRFSCRHFEHFIRAPSGVVGSRVTRVASRAAHNNIRPASLLLHGAALVPDHGLMNYQPLAPPDYSRSTPSSGPSRWFLGRMALCATLRPEHLQQSVCSEPYYSITSSARTRSERGMVRPSASAV